MSAPRWTPPGEGRLLFWVGAWFVAFGLGGLFALLLGLG